MLNGLGVVSLSVKRTSTENESLGILAVGSQQSHGLVLSLAQGIDVAHLQVGLAAHQSPLSGHRDTGSKALLRLVKRMNHHGTR